MSSHHEDLLLLCIPVTAVEVALRRLSSVCLCTCLPSSVYMCARVYLSFKPLGLGMTAEQEPLP